MPPKLRGELPIHLVNVDVAGVLVLVDTAVVSASSCQLSDSLDHELAVFPVRQIAFIMLLAGISAVTTEEETHALVCPVDRSLVQEGLLLAVLGPAGSPVCGVSGFRIVVICYQPDAAL